MSRTPIDLVGRIFGKWTVIEFSIRKQGDSIWLCECSCGDKTRKQVRAKMLKTGKSKSCGCLAMGELKGGKFGRWTVIERVKNKGKDSTWLCECECGNKREVIGKSLRHGKSVSCGCYRNETVTKHNKSRDRIYHIYHSMLRRCYIDTDKDYINYGLRGIILCDEWVDDFMNFYNWSMENRYDITLSIDRINVNGNYEPSNCRWATDKEQSLNKRNTRLLTLNGITKPIIEWAKENNLKYCTLLNRINTGWEEIELFNPIYNNKKIKNLSGVKGVLWSEKDQKWRVFTRENGKQKYLGVFVKLDDAILAKNTYDNDIEVVTSKIIIGGK